MNRAAAPPSCIEWNVIPPRKELFPLKKPPILRLLCLLLLILPGCGKAGLSADDLAFRLLNLYPALPPCSQYVKNADPYSAGYLSPEDFAYFYTGERTRLPEWDLIGEFRLILSDSTEFFEIHILKSVNATDVDEIKKLLDRRERLLLLYNKEEGDYPAKRPVVFTKGRYAVLLATDDNESALRLLERLL